MIRALIYALLIYAGYLVLKSVAKRFLRGNEQEDSKGSSRDDAELIKDPQCGAYFLKQRGVTASIEGRTIHFCSENCRDKYTKDRR